MLIGFRAGPDAGLSLASDDFAGTRRAWGLGPGTAPIGRVFPNGAFITTSHTPAQVVAKAEAACGPVLAAGMWPYFSLKPDPLPCINGQLDAHMVALANWAAGLGVPFYYSTWHEPENDAMGAGPTKDHSNHLGRAQNFVKVHNRCFQVMKEKAGDKLRIGPCHMVYQWRPGSLTTADGAVAAAWRVPDHLVDFWACDSYTSNWSWASAGASLRNKTDFQRWLSRLSPKPASIVVAERGISRTFSGVASPDGAQAELLRDDAAYLTELGAHALMYWNSGGANDDSVFLLGAPGRMAFQQIAIAAATQPPPEPVDRYDEGYEAGVAAGLVEGDLTGRKAAYTEMIEYATAKRAGTG